MKKQTILACILLSIVVSCNKTNFNYGPAPKSEPLTITLELTSGESERMALLHSSQAVSPQDVLQYAEGDAWVVDGVQLDTHREVWKTEYWYQGQVKAIVYEKRFPTYLAPFVHINWGWDGYLNC